MIDGPQLNLVVLRCLDLHESVRFYERLGLHFTPERHGHGVEHMTALVGSVTFELYPRRDGPNTTAARIGFHVRELDASLDRIHASGGTVTTPPHDSEWGRRAVVVDPDGHCVELLEVR